MLFVVLIGLVGVPSLAARAQLVPERGPGNAPDRVAAAAAARALGHPVAVEPDMTPTTEVVALPDGTFRLTESTEPVRVRTDRGWVPIDDAADQRDGTGGALGRTFIDSAYPTHAYWNGAGASDAYQHVGFIDAANSDDGKNHTTRSYWKLDTSPFAGTHVLTAKFTTTEVHSYSCSPRRVDLWSTGVIGSSTTWNTAPALITLRASATVAYGYNSSCPAAPVGFDITGFMQTAATSGYGYTTMGLAAANETDKFGWKKFSAAATLVVDFNSYPSAPAGLSVSPCPYQCVGPAITGDATPTLTAQATDADGGTLDYAFEVWAGTSATPGTRTTVGTTSLVPAGRSAAWTPTAALPDGAYEYRARAWDGIDYGPWSTWTSFVVDTTPPGLPTVTASGPISQVSDHPAGTVGVDHETITIASSVSDDSFGYAYALLPSGVNPTWPSRLVCNSAAQGYVTVCPGLGKPATLTVTMPDSVAKFSAITFDAAGNVPSLGTAPQITFAANDDYGATAVGHSWPTDRAGATPPGCGSGPVPDSNPGAIAIPLDTGGACWVRQDGAPAYTGGVPDFGHSSGVLAFDGTHAATTPTTVLDTSKSFTVAAWLKPTAAMGPGHWAIALSQDGVNESMIYLEYGQGQWAFCVPDSDAVTYSGQCAATSGVTLNSWVFVAGVYNADDHQILLYTTSTSSTPDDSLALKAVNTHDAPTPRSTGSLSIGRGRLNGVDRWWTGSVLNPIAVSGVLSSRQLHDLADLYAPSELRAP